MGSPDMTKAGDVAVEIFSPYSKIQDNEQSLETNMNLQV
jgi:hypothetical protein